MLTGFHVTGPQVLVDEFHHRPVSRSCRAARTSAIAVESAAVPESIGGTASCWSMVGVEIVVSGGVVSGPTVNVTDADRPSLPLASNARATASYGPDPARRAMSSAPDHEEDGLDLDTDAGIQCS